MKASEYFASFIQRIGVKRVYTLSGGMIAPLLDAIGEHPALRLVPVSHEQAAAFAAETEGRLANRPGVALGTNGPGALNLVTGIASAYADGVPSIFVGGQVQTYISKLVPNGRQSGLQQCDFQAVCRPISKAVLSPQRGPDVPRMLADAYRICMSGRRGPVVLEIPLDVQVAETKHEDIDFPTLDAVQPPSHDQLERMVNELANAKRPVLLVGGGIRGFEDKCQAFAIKHSLPIVSTIAGMDAAAGLGPLAIGMCGMYGSRVSNLVLSEADFILVLGSRLDHAVLGADPLGFARKRALWHVDIDPAEAGIRMKSKNIIVADCGATLDALLNLNSIARFHVLETWSARTRELTELVPTTAERPPIEGIDPNHFTSLLGEHSGAASAYVVDAGHHTWFTAQSVRMKTSQRFISSTGLHACGTGIPVAMAAALQLEGPVVAVVGDGSVQLNIQELATVVRERLPIKIVILNNSAHGSVRQLQREVSTGRYHGSVWGLSSVDHVSVFSAFGIPSRKISAPDQMKDALHWLWKEPTRAQMLEVIFDTEIDVSPTVPFGRQLSGMEPKQQGGRS